MKCPKSFHILWKNLRHHQFGHDPKFRQYRQNIRIYPSRSKRSLFSFSILKFLFLKNEWTNIFSRFGGERVYSKEDAPGEIIIRNKNPPIIRIFLTIVFHRSRVARTLTRTSGCLWTISPPDISIVNFSKKQRLFKSSSSVTNYPKLSYWFTEKFKYESSRLSYLENLNIFYREMNIENSWMLPPENI